MSGAAGGAAASGSGANASAVGGDDDDDSDEAIVRPTFAGAAAMSEDDSDDESEESVAPALVQGAERTETLSPPPAGWEMKVEVLMADGATAVDKAVENVFGDAPAAEAQAPSFVLTAKREDICYWPSDHYRRSDLDELGNQIQDKEVALDLEWCKTASDNRPRPGGEGGGKVATLQLATLDKVGPGDGYRMHVRARPSPHLTCVTSPRLSMPPHRRRHTVATSLSPRRLRRPLCRRAAKARERRRRRRRRRSAPGRRGRRRRVGVRGQHHRERGHHHALRPRHHHHPRHRRLRRRRSAAAPFAAVSPTREAAAALSRRSAAPGAAAAGSWACAVSIL